MNLQFLSKNLLALAITTILATGCGGGGSDSSSASTNNGSIAGAAAKGIMQKAIVKVFKVNAAGAKDGEAFAETVTGDDGTYSLTGLASTATSPILLELSVNSGVTTMICDALNGCGGTIIFGGNLPLPDDFVLRAILPPIDGSKAIKAQITPFSDLAVSRAIRLGSVTEDTINLAISEVNALVGVNIQNDQPVDITSAIATGNVKQQQYALLNAAIADLAFVDTNGDGIDANDLKANLVKFSEEFADGILGGNGASLNPRELFDRVKAQASDSKNGGLSSEARDQATSLADSFIGQINPDGEFDPEPSPTAGNNVTEVAQAKALVTDTRQWVASLQNLASPAEIFGSEVDTLTTTLDSNTSAVVGILANVLNQVAQAIDTADTQGTTVQTSLTIVDQNNSSNVLGTVSITDNSTATKTSFSISATNISGVSINTSIELNRVIQDNVPIPAGTLSLTVSGDAANNDVKLTLDETVFNVVLASAFDSNVDSDADPDVSSVTVTGGLEIAKRENGTATGDKVSGKVAIELVQLTNKNTGGSFKLNPSVKKLAFTDLTIATSEGNSSTGLSVSLTVNNAETFDTLAFLEGTQETADNFLNATLNISGKLKLSQNPEATGSLILNKTGLEKGDVLLTIAFDGRSLQISFNGDNQTDGSGNGTLVVSNSDGVKLTVTATEGSLEGIVTVNDKVVGKITETNGAFLIRYNDNTFESL